MLYASAALNDPVDKQAPKDSPKATSIFPPHVCEESLVLDVSVLL